MNYSRHALQRSATRNLSPEAIDYVVRNGCEFRRDGAMFYYLRRCDVVPQDRSNDRYTRLVGTAVVCSKTGWQVITTWRNRENGLQRIRRKPEYSCLGTYDLGGYATYQEEEVR